MTDPNPYDEINDLLQSTVEDDHEDDYHHVSLGNDLDDARDVNSEPEVAIREKETSATHVSDDPEDLPEETTAPARLCLLCNDLGVKRCSVCKNAHYCSATCQQRDWPIHKLLCTQLADFPEDARPSESHYRAILFPDNEDKPRFMWLKTDVRAMRGVDQEQHFEFFGNKYPGAEVIDRYRPLDRPLEHTIQLVHSDSAMIPAGAAAPISNKALNKLKAAPKGAFKGHYIAMGVKGLGPAPVNMYPTGFCDVDTQALPAIAAYLKWYYQFQTSMPRIADVVPAWMLQGARQVSRDGEDNEE